jgi:folylpolyglutamate synthase/dihydropteroate synthase
MKVSELIECLKKLKEENGDLEVRLANGHESSCDVAAFCAAGHESSVGHMTGPHISYPERLVIRGRAIR